MKAFLSTTVFLTILIFPIFSALAELPPPCGGEILVLSAEKLETLDPAMRLNPAERNASALVCETLFRRKDGRTAANLAMRSQSENDAKALRIWLKPGILFHDASPLQAAEVKAAFERLLAPSTGSPYRHLLENIVGAEAFSQGGKLELTGLRIISAYEFVIELKKADPDFAARLSHPALAICKDGGANGSGPFRVMQRRSSEVRLEANLEHRDGRPFLDRISLRYAEGVSAERRILKRAGSDASISGRVRSGEGGLIFSAGKAGPVALFQNPGRRDLDGGRFAEFLRAAFDCREAVRLFEPRSRSSFDDEKQPSCSAFAPAAARARGLAESLSKRRLKLILRSDDPALKLPAERLALEAQAASLEIEVRALNLVEYRAALASGDYDYEFAWDLPSVDLDENPPIILYRIVPEAYISNPLLGGVSFDELGLLEWADVWEAVK